MRSRLAVLYIGGAAILAAALLPIIALLPLGWLYLWQHGYLLYWFIAALIATLFAYVGRLWLLSRFEAAVPKFDSSEPLGAEPTRLSPREEQAWQDVEAMATAVDPKKISNRDALIGLGVETVQAVARRMQPGDANPTLNFTLPEALLLVERISRKLRPILIDKVPLGDQITVGQMMRVYEWRSLLGVAGKAYDIWRVIRLMNPAAATTQEVRDRLSRAMYESLRVELAQRLAGAYVREVGRAAIDLYGGRLRLTEDELAGQISAATKSDRAATQAVLEPLRFLIVGQVGAGKSSLVNALAEEVCAAVDALPVAQGFSSYEISREATPALLLIDSPGITTSSAIDAITQKAADCDLIIWVVAANRADRARDAEALARIRRHFEGLPDRRPPQILMVLTHIDRLRPFREWDPPYDVSEPSTEKARSIRDAIDAAGADLSIAPGDIVPACIAQAMPIYNIDVVWAKLLELLPEAKSAQLLRRLGETRGRLEWRRILSQAAGAGRLTAELFLRQARDVAPRS